MSKTMTQQSYDKILEAAKFFANTAKIMPVKTAR